MLCCGMAMQPTQKHVCEKHIHSWNRVGKEKESGVEDKKGGKEEKREREGIAVERREGDGVGKLIKNLEHRPCFQRPISFQCLSLPSSQVSTEPTYRLSHS